MTTVRPLSAPPRVRRPPRALTAAERVTMLKVADTLIPARADDPCASDVPDYLQWLDVALAARVDSFDAIVSALAALSDTQGSEVRDALQAMSETPDSAFHALSSVIAGAYLMSPSVRESIGYPGQHRDPPGLDEAVDQITDGILDPVVDRGPIYLAAPE